MSPPEKHGGGYIPSLKGSFDFHRLIPTRRSTTDRLNVRPKETPQYDYGHDYSRPPTSNAYPNSTTSRPHGGDYIPPTSNPRADKPPLLGRPTRVTTTPHLHYRGEKHGGDYVPQFSRSPVPSLTDSADSHRGDKVLAAEAMPSGGTDSRRNEWHGGGYVPSFQEPGEGTSRPEVRQGGVVSYSKR
ncbi:hypothetical protein BDW59DRAFT_155242 [Aspergillus cavernicola]|uniref:Pal1 cell morphology protein-domain-containing protein n=1 Tax=Aspergillus cavernicola TaxID=176166 RepID=A0ABR4HB03_9EURO